VSGTFALALEQAEEAFARHLASWRPRTPAVCAIARIWRMDHAAVSRIRRSFEPQH